MPAFFYVLYLHQTRSDKYLFIQVMHLANHDEELDMHPMKCSTPPEPFFSDDIESRIRMLRA